jgi:hypothetical protein
MLSGSVEIGNSLFFNNWEEAQREVFVSKGFVDPPGLMNRRDTDTGCDCIVVICSYSSLCVATHKEP